MSIQRMLAVRRQLRQPTPADLPPVLHVRDLQLTDDSSDDKLAMSELEGRLSRMIAAIAREADRLDGMHVRYQWTDDLRRRLLAIAHDTGMGG